MITDSFDDQSEAKINPEFKDGAPKVDACIVTFSYVIEKYVIDKFNCKKIAEFKAATGITPIYEINYKGKRFAFYKTSVGAPACVGTIENANSELDTNKFVVFGGSGCLDKEIAHGKIMVPFQAYRDEGTSYHYQKASDYIDVKNAKIVSEFMKENEIPYVEGKTWTTDAFYRETINNMEKRKKEGCISVEMECAGIQAMCNFRNLEFYTFLNSGDLLDSPRWDPRHAEGEFAGTQHDGRLFDIALDLAHYIA